jgi:hypothetical protein
MQGGAETRAHPPTHKRMRIRIHAHKGTHAHAFADALARARARAPAPAQKHRHARTAISGARPWGGVALPHPVPVSRPKPHRRRRGAARRGSRRPAGRALRIGGVEGCGRGVQATRLQRCAWGTHAGDVRRDARRLEVWARIWTTLAAGGAPAGAGECRACRADRDPLSRLAASPKPSPPRLRGDQPSDSHPSPLANARRFAPDRQSHGAHRPRRDASGGPGSGSCIRQRRVGPS